MELDSLELLEELLVLVVDSDVASRPRLFAAAMNVATSSVELEELELLELLELPEPVELLELLLVPLVELELAPFVLDESELDEVEVDELLMSFAVPAGVWSVLPVRPI